MPVIANGVTTGSVVEHSSGAIPIGYLLCDGTPVPQATYPGLWSVIGAAFNTGGEAVGTFRVPNLCGKTVIGAGQDVPRGLTNRAFSSFVGTETHTLLSSQIPAHTHGATSATESEIHTHTATTNNVDLTHTHTYVALSGDTGTDGSSTANTSKASASYPNTTGLSATLAHAHTAPSSAAQLQTHTHTVTTGNGDSVAGSSHNNIQPALVITYIIKT